VLAELDGTVLAKLFAARRIKLYHYRDITKPIIRIEWNKHARDNYDILDDEEPEDEDEFDSIQDHEISRIAAYKVLKVREGPKIPHPWELRGKQCDEYWQKVYENWKSGENEKRLQENIPSEWEKAIREFHEEDSQFWNYCWDYHDMDIDEIPRWKVPPPMQPSLFVWKELGKWLPPGPPTFANQNIRINENGTDHEDAFIRLGDAHIKTIHTHDVSTQMLADQCVVTKQRMQIKPCLKWKFINYVTVTYQRKRMWIDCVMANL
jgi:hypothetical protein